MPLILATTDSPKSGPGYRDKTGERYEYPLQYQGLVSEGERFLYYRPGSRIYFGSGIVGRIGSSPSDPSRLMCEIENFAPFANPVPLRDQTNEYYEAVGPHPWPGWRNGVREISDYRFSRILDAAMATAHLPASPSDDGPPPSEPSGGSRQTAAYAASDVAQAVEQYSVMVAVQEARDRFPGETVRPMPHSNPGFDIWVGGSDSATRFIEVKGTRIEAPVFIMSEGERLFSERNASRYTLMVVTGIDLDTSTHRGVTSVDGSLAAAAVELEPLQWRGRIDPSDS